MHRTMAKTLIAVAVGVAIVGSAAVQSAQAGEYVLVACDPLHRGEAGASFHRNNGGDYAFGKHCTHAPEANSLQVRSISSVPETGSGAIRWLAPAHTAVTGVAIEASLRRDQGHRARLSFVNAAGVEAGRIATGADQPAGFEQHSARQPDGRGGFEAALVCEGQDRCPQSDQARASIRGLRLTLDDRRAPSVAPTGDLLDAGWVRGNRDLTVSASDGGSGVRRVEVAAGETELPVSRTFACETVSGTALVTAASPCELERRMEAGIDTAAAPFHDGVNPLSVCVLDFGPDANETCEEHEVAIDNTPPSAAFRRSDPEDPELISATVADAHSGPASATIAYRPIAGGQWRELDAAIAADGVASARVDSSAEPSGRYRFQIQVHDGAGNTTETDRRADGSEMVLDFPLRERSAVTARVRPEGARHGYGSRPRLTGRLILGGEAEGERVEVVERMEPGSERAQRVRSTTTDAAGRFQVRLAAGPSRRVVVHYPGSRRYLPARSKPRRLAVLGSAQLRLNRKRVPAGKRVQFRGSIGHLGAEIPTRGKVVELQVRERGSGRFRTVRQALQTDRKGRIRTSYSFDRFYTRPTKFEFRLRVTPQARWPYRAPAHSKARTLTVLPR